MLNALLTGFFLGLSLIVAIGAQNAFVLRQGLLRQHVFFIALFCSMSDAILIILGILGISYFFNELINEYSKFIFGISSLWLFIYGVFRLRSALIKETVMISNNQESSSLVNTITIISIFTFANPHVYLDTVILIGSISQQFDGFNRLYYSFGACSASFIWFFGLAYGAKILAPVMKKSSHWRALDLIIASIMFFIAISLAYQGNWF